MHHAYTVSFRPTSASLKAPRHNQRVDDPWFEQARAAEDLNDWDTAIALVAPRAECYSADYHAHHNHLWHLDLLARAGRHADLAELATTDVHARRRLNRSLRESGPRD